MRIGLVAPPWIPVPPRGYGGTEMVVGLLAEGLVEAGHDVVMVAHADSEIERVELIPAPPIPDDALIGQVAIELAHAVWAYRQLVDREPDIIHDHTTAGPLAGAPLAAAAGIPTVTTCHGPFDAHVQEFLAATAPVCPVIAISADQASRAGRVPVTAVIHHGIDVRRIPVGDGRGGYFAFLGRFTPDKGPRRAALIARRADVPLRIAGKMWEPAEVEYFQTEIEPLLGDGVEYVGEIGGPEKFEFLGGAIALLNPIDWSEPFGLTMIESLACGTPVVATPRGSAPEIVEVGRTGLLPSTDEEFVAALRGCPQLDRTRCREVAEQRFSTRRMADEHTSLYRRLVAGASPVLTDLTQYAAAGHGG
jgi:glycosyltransferase involved in cell wall biosynthesis